MRTKSAWAWCPCKYGHRPEGIQGVVGNGYDGRWGDQRKMLFIGDWITRPLTLQNEQNDGQEDRPQDAWFVDRDKTMPIIYYGFVVMYFKGYRDLFLRVLDMDSWVEDVNNWKVRVGTLII
jgi:hypothetical protein